MWILTQCRWAVALWPLTGLFIAAGVVHAHHGSATNNSLFFAENPDEPVELEGVIREIFWRAPHVRYRMEDADGKTWELEFAFSPISFIRRGIASEDFLRVGDFVKAAGFIARSDPNSLGVINLLLPNGQESVYRNTPPRWSNEILPWETLAPAPAKVEEAKRAAESIFRVWSIRQAPQPPLSAYHPYLTERGRELAANLDPGGADALELQCMTGMPTAMFERSMMQFEDQGDRIHIWVEQYNTHRYIYMNPETAPEPVPSNVGYSLGHWEGDVLVVNTTHINHPTFDEGATPQSDQASYVERFSTSEDGEWLNYTFTVTDPVVFTEPVTLEMPRRWLPGEELHLFDCAVTWEN